MHERLHQESPSGTVGDRAELGGLGFGGPRTALELHHGGPPALDLRLQRHRLRPGGRGVHGHRGAQLVDDHLDDVGRQPEDLGFGLEQFRPPANGFKPF
jgi:hypothetical protein